MNVLTCGVIKHSRTYGHWVQVVPSVMKSFGTFADGFTDYEITDDPADNSGKRVWILHRV
jgi:hypothetical protein